MTPAVIGAIVTGAVAIIGAVFTGIQQYRHANDPSAHTPAPPPKP